MPWGPGSSKALLLQHRLFEFLVFRATFEAGACGVWRESIDGNTGDIVC